MGAPVAGGAASIRLRAATRFRATARSRCSTGLADLHALGRGHAVGVARLGRGDSAADLLALVALGQLERRLGRALDDLAIQEPLVRELDSLERPGPGLHGHCLADRDRAGQGWSLVLQRRRRLAQAYRYRLAGLRWAVRAAAVVDGHLAGQRLLVGRAGDNQARASTD